MKNKDRDKQIIIKLDIEYDNVWNTSHGDIKILKDYIRREIL